MRRRQRRGSCPVGGDHCGSKPAAEAHPARSNHSLLGRPLAGAAGGAARRHATHTHPKVEAWLARHPRWTFHFTPKSGSWLNAVEGFFSKLTRQRLGREVFRSIVDLQAAINRFLAETNDNPKPFTWTTDPHAIIEKVRRGKQVLESLY